MNCSFAGVPVYYKVGLGNASSKFMASPRPARFPTTAPKKRARVSCLVGPEDVPDEIKDLDEKERIRRVNLSREPLQYVLKEDTKNALLEIIPELADIDRRLAKSMQEHDYDPDDYRAYSWAYKKLRPWAPSVLLQVVAAAGSFWLSRNTVLALRARISYSQMLSFSLIFDSVSALSLSFVCPLILVLWTLKNNRTGTDAFRRIAIMYTLSSVLLLPLVAVSSVGRISASLTMGIVLRIMPLTISLWYWRDLCRQVFVARTLFKKVFQTWRFLTTLFVVLGGTAIRVAALTLGNHFPFADSAEKFATQTRLRLGSRFPVALSLFNDPRGLFFGASLMLFFGLLYFLYFSFFVVDFFRNRDHRKTNSILTDSLINAGVYQPNIHPKYEESRATATNGVESFLPAAAMKLRKVEGLLATDTTYLSREEAMPLFSLLDKEAEFIAEDGVDRWMKPRDELVPLSKDLTEGQRSTDALLSWARPLDEEQTDMSFVEFFETLEENEYMYDATTGDWVFDKETDTAAGLNGQSTDSNGGSDITSGTAADVFEDLLDKSSSQRTPPDESIDFDSSGDNPTIFV